MLSNIAQCRGTGFLIVDAQREIDYAVTGYTKYQYAIFWARDHWNSLGRVFMRSHGEILPPTPLPADVDVSVEDYWSNASGAPRAYYQSRGGADWVRFNQFEMDKSYSTTDWNRGTAVHEFGHAHGLAHSTLPNVMGVPIDNNRCIVPCANDIAVYNALWPPLFARTGAPDAGAEGAPAGAQAPVEFEYDYDPHAPAQLGEKADNVFVATVLAEQGTDKKERKPEGRGGFLTTDDGLVHTSFRVRVHRVAKGDVRRELVIRQVGGIEPATGQEVVSADGARLVPGRKYVLFTSRDAATGKQTVVAPGHGDVPAESTAQVDALIGAARR